MLYKNLKYLINIIITKLITNLQMMLKKLLFFLTT